MDKRNSAQITDKADTLLTQLQISVRLATEMCEALKASTAIPVPTLSLQAVEDANNQRVQVYWIGCAGLAQAAKKLGANTRIDRIGCTIEPELADRLSAAAADAYASWSLDETGRLVQQAGFTQWMLQAIQTTRSSTDPDIKVKTRSIEVRLPAGMSRRQFDRALHLGLKRWHLSEIYPQAVRFTLYSVGTDRMSQAWELYTGLDPRRDGTMLLSLIETILKSYRRSGERSASRATSEMQPPRAPTLFEMPPLIHRRPRRMTPAQQKAMQARLRRQNGR